MIVDKYDRLDARATPGKSLTVLNFSDSKPVLTNTCSKYQSWKPIQ